MVAIGIPVPAEFLTPDTWGLNTLGGLFMWIVNVFFAFNIFFCFVVVTKAGLDLIYVQYAGTKIEDPAKKWKDAKNRIWYAFWGLFISMLSFAFVRIINVSLGGPVSTP